MGSGSTATTREISLVTGGAGFIGSHLVEALTAAGKTVRVLDNFDTGLPNNLEHISPAPTIVRGDVSDPATVLEASRGVEIVYHLAALASVQKSVEQPDLSHRICCTGTVNVLDAARKNGVRRVVFAASSSAYGAYSSPSPQNEEVPLAPLSPYAAAKLASEMYLQAFTASYGLETVRLRFFNIFGPRQRADSPYSGVIAIFLSLLSSDRTPTIYGDGLHSRDFVYVGNAVQALRKAAAAPSASGKVFNIGTGRSVTLRELVQAINRLIGKNIQPKFAEARAGDVRFSCADITRAQSELGYSPKISLEEGLAKTLAWTLAQSGKQP
jgi:UDP-glucose 4-epimerase